MDFPVALSARRVDEAYRPFEILCVLSVLCVDRRRRRRCRDRSV